ncbi:MAG: C10 family peptidase [Bacteroidaceae bacterium]|nr:C10 family peptidase [Bacteroidaceae bacterium]
MRRIFGIWLLLLPMVLMAAPVSQEQAMQRARVFVNSRPRIAQGGKLKAARAPLKLQSAQATASYYVFNVGEGQGFVIASGDDRTPAILGYADDGQFDADNIPSNMQAWLEDYERQMSLLDKYPAAQATSTIHEAIDPLLITTWSQETPYNDMCPIVDGIQAPTGCAATAMAQILNYYKYPDRTTKTIPAYTTDSDSIDMPEIPVTDIDWDNMLDDYKGSSTTAQKNAVATLMKLCGYAMQTEYHAEASGSPANLVAKVLQDYFGYDETVHEQKRVDFSASEWENLIYDELANSRPVFYLGFHTYGGHGFVVDGYDGDGMFHINWGWNGDGNGYYLLSVLNPNSKGLTYSYGDDGYSFEQAAFVGIQHSTGEKFAERFDILGITNKGESSYVRNSPSEDFIGLSISIRGYNQTCFEHQFRLGLGLYKPGGEAVKMLVSQSEETIMPYYGHSSLLFDSFDFGAGLEDGDYYITPVSYTENSEDWEPCWGSNVYRIKATISGNTLTLTEPSINLSGTFAPIDSTKIYTTVNVQAQITNNGSYFNNYVYLAVDNVIAGGRIFEAEAGETATFDIDFKPKSAGTKTLKLYLKNDDGGFTTFAIGSITIIEEDEGVKPLLTGTTTLTNANSKNVVEETTVNISAEFQNIGDGAFVDDWVFIVLYKRDTETKKWNRIDYKSQIANINPGNNATIRTSFKNLEFGGAYCVNLRYTLDGGKTYTYLNENNTYFDVVDPAAPAPVMTGSIALTNANANGDIEGTTVNAEYTVQNTGTAALENGGLWIELYQVDASGQGKYLKYKGVNITLGVGESESRTDSFDNLEVGGRYYLILTYNLYGSSNYMPIDDTAIYFNVVEEGSGIETLPTTTLPFTSTYDLQGRRVSANHRGLVISRELKPDGTVVVRKVIN